MDDSTHDGLRSSPFRFPQLSPTQVNSTGGGIVIRSGIRSYIETDPFSSTRSEIAGAGLLMWPSSVEWLSVCG
jgi:hypothetical protein